MLMGDLLGVTRAALRCTMRCGVTCLRNTDAEVIVSDAAQVNSLLAASCSRMLESRYPRGTRLHALSPMHSCPRVASLYTLFHGPLPYAASMAKAALCSCMPGLAAVAPEKRSHTNSVPFLTDQHVTQCLLSSAGTHITLPTAVMVHSCDSSLLARRSRSSRWTLRAQCWRWTRS